ncbi:MAG: ferritin [Bacilli bacterium]|jgi:ferritin|nr:ferritin [Bacilli bacterium]
MLNEKVTKLLNEQINKEFYSAYLYLDMANFYTNKGLDGFANWFNVQALEEQSHAMLFVKYLQNNGFAVTLEAIAKPHLVYKDLKEPLLGALEHEKFVTASIHNIYDVAMSVKDYRTMEFLNWFVKEQGEEEMNAENLILAFENFGKQVGPLYAMNHELKERKFSEPSLDLD